MTQARRPHEQRVIAEKSQLDARMKALQDFVDGEMFPQIVPADEQDRLQRQLAIMLDYSLILAERIATFPPLDLNNPGPRGQEKYFPVDPQPGHAQQVPVTEDELVTMKSVNEFAGAVAYWHGGLMDRLKNLLTIPYGTPVELVEADGYAFVVKLKGDAMKGFKAAMNTAIAELQNLPFVVSVEDAPEQGQNDAAAPR